MKMTTNSACESLINWMGIYKQACSGLQKSNFDIVAVDYFEVLSSEDSHNTEELDEHRLLNK